MSAKTEYCNKTEVFSKNRRKYMGSDINSHVHTCRVWVWVYNEYYLISFHFISFLVFTLPFFIIILLMSCMHSCIHSKWALSLCVCYFFLLLLVPLLCSAVCGDVLSFVYVIFIAHTILPYPWHWNRILFHLIFGPHSFNTFQIKAWVWQHGIAAVCVCLHVWFWLNNMSWSILFCAFASCYCRCCFCRCCYSLVFIHLIFRFCTAVRADDFVYATSHIYAC